VKVDRTPIVRFVMFHRLALLVMLGALPAVRSEALSSFAVPSPGVIESLNRQLHRNDWLRITTDSARYEARVREIGAPGLGGLSPVRPSIAVPEAIPWSAVASLDRRRSSLRLWQVAGFAAGGTLGFCVLGGTGSAMGGARAMEVVALGVIAGTWSGSRLGAHRYRERRLYEGWPTDSAAVAVSGAPDGPVPLDSTRIANVLWRLQPKQRLRISGEFGTFEGFVGLAGREGLEGLMPSRKADQNSQWPRELGWDRISTIETLGNKSAHSAFVTGAALAGLGFLIGMPLGGVTDPSKGAFLAGGLIGAGIMGSLGMVFGGIAGSASTTWHVVYQRP
jgi:hypothetical protein